MYTQRAVGVTETRSQGPSDAQEGRRRTDTLTVSLAVAVCRPNAHTVSAQQPHREH